MFDFLFDTVKDKLESLIIGEDNEHKGGASIKAPDYALDPEEKKKAPSGTSPSSYADKFEHPQVKNLVLELEAIKKFEGTVNEEKNEESGVGRDQLVDKIRSFRDKMECLAFPGLTLDQIRAFKMWAYQEINAISPYYSQGRSVDFLELSDRTRICNLTSLAMCLEALGKSSKDYGGNIATIQEIRDYKGSGGNFNYSKSFDKAKLTTGKSVHDLRLPDFLQLAMVAHHMDNGKSMKQGVKSAWDDILFMNRFAKIARKFGAGAKHVGSLGEGKSRKEKFENSLGAELNAGKQIVMLTPGHYVRLEAITEEGLIVDDPGKTSKKDMLVPWEKTKGYFKGALVISLLSADKNTA